MRKWATFLYGLAVGITAAWASGVLIESYNMSWLPFASVVVFGMALVVHQRVVARSKGRRWRKTI